jgi:GTP-binding protein EngB required for normal cell division
VLVTDLRVGSESGCKKPLINLPQIIVVGDQSSGKSSVLEAIPGVQFPVDGSLCTRFATELILRRAADPSLNVSIQYTDDASRTDASPEPFRKSGFDKSALAEIISEAKQRMEISAAGKKGFSRDILRVETAEPDVYSLTLVDLPGSFYAETAGQSRQGKEIVEQLVNSYMSQEKSIILTVVTANNQLANQIVVEAAKTHDPTRQRTLGVITKPDLAGRGTSNEQKFLELADNREEVLRLKLGWVVLKNLSEEQKAAGANNRDEEEREFFASGNWALASNPRRNCRHRKSEKEVEQDFARSY